MNKLEQAARQALEALEVYEIKLNSRLCNEAITALREALANTRSSIRSTSEYSEQAEQGPVHWVVPDFGFLFPSEDAAQRYLINIESDARPTPCYAAPVRTKDLTDDEILPDGYGVVTTYDGLLEFARAVIAADRELNK